jgi:hypothetical protein
MSERKKIPVQAIKNCMDFLNGLAKINGKLIKGVIK